MFKPGDKVRMKQDIPNPPIYRIHEEVVPGRWDIRYGDWSYVQSTEELYPLFDKGQMVFVEGFEDRVFWVEGTHPETDEIVAVRAPSELTRNIDRYYVTAEEITPLTEEEIDSLMPLLNELYPEFFEIQSKEVQ